MSENILKALMQLFAIIANPESNAKERQTIVASYLKQQLNQELVDQYLKVFEEYFDIYQKRQGDKEKQKKRITSSSVRVLKICTEINEELTQKQKIIVVFRLLEFIKADKTPTEQEEEFVATVADTFFIPQDEYVRMKAFVHYSLEQLPNSSRILVVNDQKEFFHPKLKHLYREFLNGQLWVFHLTIANMYMLRYMGENELYMNGQPIQKNKVYVLTVGSSIRDSKIKPIYYSDVISAYHADKQQSKIFFDVKNVEYRFKNGNIGIHRLSFSEESGRLVGIMGASGAGKSTLLNVLNGILFPSEGEVLVNGINVHTEKNKLEGLIGYVSQDDLLIEDLTVFQNLYFNAKLCFDNLENFHIIRMVTRLLQTLGLFDIKDMKVGNPLDKRISGGQRKRLNIALELIREPQILFLDEPTSGLSSRDSENIMDLLKELALKGKLVFVVIHQPSSDIFKMFDRLIILDTGGYLIYSGDPVDSIMYFKSSTHQANWSNSECVVCGNVNPEQIFNIVESQVLDEYGNLTQTRKISPKEWNQSYLEYAVEKELISEFPDRSREITSISFKIPNPFKQFLVFVQRDVLSKLANKQYLFINLLESPILAFFLAYIIKYFSVDADNEVGYTFAKNSNIPVYIFMGVIVAIFVGLTVSAEEIISDRKILKREAFLNLSWSSYLMSKVTILLVLSAIQAFTFIIIGNYIMEIKGMYWQFWLVLFSTWCVGNLVGLNISDSFKTAVTIYILIPFLVIPNIILSGVMVKFDKLNPNISSPSSIPFYGEIIPARWAYEAIAVYQFKENKYEKMFYPYDKSMSIATYKKDYLLKELSNIISNCKRDLVNPEKKEQLVNDLELLRNEIKIEQKANPKIPFKSIDKLYYDKINPTVINEVSTYLEILNKYYIKRYNKAAKLKDNIIASLQNSEQKRMEFIKLKDQHYNDKLEEFLKNTNDIDRIVKYKNRFYQKLDPIFQDPDAWFLKAHFYAPRKKLFGVYVDTFWVNIIVLWSIAVVLYISLYYRLLKRLIDRLEEQGFTRKQRKQQTLVERLKEKAKQQKQQEET